MGLLKDQRFRCRNLLPHRFILPLLVGRFLPRTDFIQCPPFGLHSYVRVPGEHGAGDVPGDAHDYLVARTPVREFRDERVPVRGLRSLAVSWAMSLSAWSNIRTHRLELTG